ncbi:MBOAT family O-acyltransferase [Gimesia panareensis]|uniref:MBOAT family O-acyltransferase n=1 Tax=Gimesia panareensis TaxID=2527978 RepID=UPI001187A336|nr:MBOAT family O-acyltransferase [Gimesia panareensis]QDU51827.1 Peptidoglycan O-acetyltransferase [Gimesia panareensis]
MLFNSPQFLLLLLLTVPLYWLVRDQRARILLILVSSCIFYMSWSVQLYFLLVGMSCLHWLAGRLLWNRSSKLVLTIAVTISLMVLGYFKYTHFFLNTFNALSNHLHGSVFQTEFEIILPLGISFYIFQLISYSVDCYRKDCEFEQSFVTHLAFVSFFPQLIAGPICRAKELLPQLKEIREFDRNQFLHGCVLLCNGLFLKVAIADNLSPFVNQVYGNVDLASLTEIVLAVISFGIVILCDFWGYSTMALGAAALFGIALPQNFNLPYSATSIQDFWRRWHITLSLWLRDYLYIPLGGSRKGENRTLINLLIVMLLGGLWHGAAWAFVIWGGIHGGWLAGERLFFRHVKPRISLFNLQSKIALFCYRLAGWLITMTIVFLAWIPFRITDFATISKVFSRLFYLVPAEGISQQPHYGVVITLILFLVLHVPIHQLNNQELQFRFQCNVARISYCFWSLIFAFILGAADVETFIYFQF